MFESAVAYLPSLNYWQIYLLIGFVVWALPFVTSGGMPKEWKPISFGRLIFLSALVLLLWPIAIIGGIVMAIKMIRAKRAMARLLDEAIEKLSHDLMIEALTARARKSEQARHERNAAKRVEARDAIFKILAEEKAKAANEKAAGDLENLSRA